MSLNILAISDVHLSSSNPVGRKDNLIKTQFKKLKFVFNYAQKHKCIILQAGDFLDKSRDWQLLVLLIDFFSKYKDVEFHQVLGQHDSYFYSSTKATTIGVLNKLKMVNILNQHSPYSKRGWHIWGSGWDETLPQTTMDKNILVTHRPISEYKLFPGQNYTKPKAFFKQTKNFKLIIVGDVHRAFYYTASGRYIVNTGPMLRSQATIYNYTHIPHFYHFKVLTNYKAPYFSVKKIVIPHQQSDSILSRSHLIKETKSETNIDSLSSIIKETNPENSGKGIFKKLFADQSISPRIRKKLKEIYNNAKG